MTQDSHQYARLLSEESLQGSYPRPSGEQQIYSNRPLSAKHEWVNGGINENFTTMNNLKDTYNEYVKYQSQLAKHSLGTNPTTIPKKIK